VHDHLGRALLATSVAALVCAGTLTAAPAASAAPAKDRPVKIKVRTTPYRTVDGVKVTDVSESVVGSNQRWPDDGKGVWDPVTGQPAPNVVRLSKEAGLRLLRYPGGTVANTFDFRSAIGPQAQRGCQTSGGFANGRFAATDSRFGPDENEKMAEAIGGESMVMLAPIGRSASYAADYVEYMNSPADGAASNPSGGTDWAEVRAANGHPEPYGVHYWEFGNEPYLTGQHYWWSADAATRVQQFIRGGWQRQGVQDPVYKDNDGLFSGCDLLNRKQGSGQPGQSYRVRFGPIGLPGDEAGSTGVGDGPITEPVLRVAGTTWTRVASLADQAADAQVYTVDQQAGTVSFGDGVHGAVPAAGASLSIEYTSGVQGGYTAFRDAMRAVDPSIEVCSGWGTAQFVDAMGSRPYDCLGAHSYTVPPDDGTISRYDALQAGAATRDAELRDLRQRMASHFPSTADRPDLLVTEYGTVDVPTQAYEARLGHTLYLASQVAGQLENDARASINSNTADLPAGRGTTDSAANLLGSAPFFTTARSLMLRLYASTAGGELVRSNVRRNPLLSHPTGSYDALRVVSTCDDGLLRTIVVNRDDEHRVKATLAVPKRAVRGTVRVKTVNGASIDSYNLPEHPDDVTLETSRAKVRGGKVRHAFERHSVTMLTYRVRGRSC
jgi:alpha-L-arabinofuranosidase